MILWGILWLSLKYNKAHLYFAAQTTILNTFSELIVTFIVNVAAAITINCVFLAYCWERGGLFQLNMGVKILNITYCCRYQLYAGAKSKY